MRPFTHSSPRSGCVCNHMSTPDSWVGGELLEGGPGSSQRATAGRGCLWTSILELDLDLTSALSELLSWLSRS